MPEHVHLLTDEPAKGMLAIFLRTFKQLTSRELKSAKEKQLWHRRYYDLNVHFKEKRIEKIRYLHRNPVTRGLVTRPEEYRWSSFNLLCHWRSGDGGD